MLTPQHLLIDADDTLWENCAYFARAVASFLDIMEGRGHPRDRAHENLLTHEAARTRAKGYGSRNFARSLGEVVTLMEGTVSEELQASFTSLGTWIFEHPIEVFKDVPATLEDLGRRHDLLLVTKGDREEQERKIAMSGLRSHFRAVEVLREKDPESFKEVLLRHGLPRAHTWMVGNSPKSDMNPARAVGLRTVFIPHHTIWEMEDVPLDHEPDLLLHRFSELTRHF